MKEKVSVIIPCYNVAAFVSKCMNSVVNQTYTNLEIIAINDGSTDGTLKILKSFEQQDVRVKVLDQENVGLSATRNRGIDESTGIYIVFVDSDDWLALNYIEEMMQHAAQKDLVICSYFKGFKKKAIARKLHLNGMYEALSMKRRLVGLVASELHDPSQLDSIGIVWAKLYRSTIIKTNAVEFVSTKHIGTSEDLLFNLQYLEKSKNVFVVDIPLYYYRKDNEASYTSYYKENLFEKWQHLFHKIDEINTTKEDIFIKAFHNRICLSIIGLGLNELRNPTGVSAQLKQIRTFLNNDLYKKSFSQLEFRYFPIHWKVFFILAKYRLAVGVLLMLKCIKYIIEKNN